MIDTIMNDIKVAMKAGDKLKVGTLRMLMSEIKNLQIEKGGAGTKLEEGDLLALLKRGVKKRTEAADAFRNAGREVDAAREEKEATFIQAYLPEELGDEELERVVDEIIADTGAVSKRDMGKVMGAIMTKYKGRVDGKAVQALVSSKLS
jgi:uncharacterized protein YqeY